MLKRPVNKIQTSNSEIGKRSEAVITHNSQRPSHAVYDALVLNAQSRQMLVTVRSLGSRGLRVAAQEPAMAIAVSKERTLEIAGQLGIGVPRAVIVGDVSEVGAALREIRLPAVVKPVESWVGKERTAYV